MLVDTTYNPSLTNGHVTSTAYDGNSDSNLRTEASSTLLDMTRSTSDSTVAHEKPYMSVHEISQREQKNSLPTHNPDQTLNGSFLFYRDKVTGIEQPQSRRPHCVWWYCIQCKRYSPPRSHHCSLCNKCILKHDHHCFVAASCVGYRNLRHFTVFVSYAAVATVFAIVHALPYAYYNVIPKVSYPDLFYPIAVLRGVFGYVDFIDMILIVLGWMLLNYLIFSIYTLIRVFKLISTGRTSYEVTNRLNILDVRCVQAKLKAVFGRRWMWNFLFPMHFWDEPLDDPIRWPYLKFNGQYLS